MSRLLASLTLLAAALGAPLALRAQTSSATSSFALTEQAPVVTANGFAINFSVTVQASPAALYEALTTRVQQWWNPAHTFASGTGTLSIDARPGGCFCESFPGGGGVEHMRVVFVRPGSVLRLTGALGPMQGTGLAGALTFEVKPVDGGSRLDVAYVVGGYIPMGLDKIAPMAQVMLAEQARRLKSFVETGAPVPARK